MQQASPMPRITYGKCLKNHAASIGGIALDGCGEFMPRGGDGTLEALKCAACSCHRNFHRKEHHEGAMVQSMKVPFGVGMVSAGEEKPATKKRHRTKFAVEQKEKMMEFAEKVGWKIPNENDAELQRFCGEVGVTRRVFKVWMHNNKTTNGAAKKPPQQEEDQIEKKSVLIIFK